MEPTNMGQSLLDPPSVEGWHTGAEWIDSGSLVRRINFVADRVGDINLPGVRDIVDRVRAQGDLTPDELVDSCIDLIGPTQVNKLTHEELMTQARAGGDVSWASEQDADRSTQRVLQMLQLIAASREYQFG
jgi:hypothetical protein